MTVLALNKEEVKPLTMVEKKELLIKKLFDSIESRLEYNLTTTFTTCSDAPSFGWSVEEYLYMPEVANRLRSIGRTVSSKVNFGVTDWSIAV